MPDLWTITALQLVTILGGVVAGACALAIGGLGGQRLLRTAVAEIKSALERTDERITREVKTRAGAAGVQARTEKDVTEEATRLLAEGASGPGGTSRRPRVVR